MGNIFLIMTQNFLKIRGKKDSFYYKQQQTSNHGESIIQRSS